MARRSRVKGAASFRRLIKALPDSAHNQLLGFLNSAGPVLQQQIQSELPVLATPRPDRTPGALRASIKFKVTPSTLNLKVGEISKRDILFYGHILDGGRKGGTVPIKRGPRAGGTMHISPLRGLYVLTHARATFVNGSLPGYRTLMDQILQDAARGAGDD